MASFFSTLRKFTERTLSRQDDSIANRKTMYRYDMLKDYNKSAGYGFSDQQLNAVNENVESIISFYDQIERLNKAALSSTEKVRKLVEQEIPNLEGQLAKTDLKYGKNSEESKNLRRRINSKRVELDKQENLQSDIKIEVDILNEEFFEPLREKFMELYKLSSDEVEQIFDTFKNKQGVKNFRRVSADANRIATDEVQEQVKLQRRNERIQSFLSSDGISSLQDTVRTLTEDLGLFGVVVNKLLADLIKVNTIFVKFNREMSLGMSSENLFDSDLYGYEKTNGLVSYKRDLDTQNLEFEDFLSTFKAFSKGNILGTNTEQLKDNSKSMRALGVTSSLLMKQYSVNADTLNSITEGLFYNYGLSVSKINEILSNGRKIATEAGVSVKNYYENLKQATEAIGDFYIIGGAKGLEQLALSASKLGIATNEILKISEKYKGFTSQFDIQGKAMALGMKNFSQASRAIWALSMTGQHDKAASLETASQLQDFRNMGAFDSSGNINQVGMMTSKSLNLSKEQIETITRLNKKYDELGKEGFTIEEITGVKPLDQQKQKKLEDYEKSNATIGERFTMATSKLMKLFEGLGMVMAPVIDIVLSVLNILGDLASVVGDFLMPGFRIMGDGIEFVKDGFVSFGNFINGFTGWLSKLNARMIEGNTTLSKFIKAVSFAAASLMTLSLLPGVGGRVSKGMKGTKLGKGISKVFKMPKASSILRGGVWGVAGSMLGSMIGGDGGDTIGNIASGAAMGSMFGPIGTVIGGAAGLLYSSSDRISKVWEDENMSTAGKIGKSFGAIWDTTVEAGKAIKTSVLGESDPAKGSIADGVEDAVRKGAKEGIIEGTKKLTQNNYNTANLAGQATYLKKVEDIIVSRRKVVDEGQATQEREEKLRKENINLVVNTNTSLYGPSIKSRIQQR